MSDSPVVVLGAGGHAKVVASVIRSVGRKIAAVLDDREDLWGQQLAGLSVRGPIAQVKSFTEAEFFIAIGDNAIRLRLAEQLDGLVWATLIHPFSYVDKSATIGAGTVVMAGSVIQPEVRIGRHVIVNTGSSIDHESVIGDYAHVANAHLSGRVKVGVGAFLGVGSCLIPNVRIGEWTQVGAGAVVNRDLAPNVTAVGVPARPLKNRVIERGFSE